MFEQEGMVTCSVTRILMFAGTVDVYTFGSASHGQLGYETREQQTFPRLVDKLVAQNARYIACGSEHTAVILHSGQVLVWGNGTNGRLGLGNEVTYPTPQRLVLPRTAVQVACGDAFTVFLLDDGALYACGYNRWGQLGVADTRDRLTPTAILGIRDSVVRVACGAMHCAAITNDGSLYTWGCGLSGQLGANNFSSSPAPVRVALVGTGSPTPWLVACGSAHTLVVTTAGQVWGCGANNVGQVGIPRSEDTKQIAKFTPLPSLGNEEVVEVACGSVHSVVRTATGRVLAFGRGAGHRLGTGSTADTDEPRTVMDGSGWGRVVQMACGESVTCFLTGMSVVRQCDTF